MSISRRKFLLMVSATPLHWFERASAREVIDRGKKEEPEVPPSTSKAQYAEAKGSRGTGNNGFPEKQKGPNNARVLSIRGLKSESHQNDYALRFESVIRIDEINRGKPPPIVTNRYSQPFEARMNMDRLEAHLYGSNVSAHISGSKVLHLNTNADLWATNPSLYDRGLERHMVKFPVPVPRKKLQNPSVSVMGSKKSAHLAPKKPTATVFPDLYSVYFRKNRQFGLSSVAPQDSAVVLENLMARWNRHVTATRNLVHSVGSSHYDFRGIDVGSRIGGSGNRITNQENDDFIDAMRSLGLYVNDEREENHIHIQTNMPNTWLPTYGPRTRRMPLYIMFPR